MKTVNFSEVVAKELSVVKAVILAYLDAGYTDINILTSTTINANLDSLKKANWIDEKLRPTAKYYAVLSSEFQRMHNLEQKTQVIIDRKEVSKTSRKMMLQKNKQHYIDEVERSKNEIHWFAYVNAIEYIREQETILAIKEQLTYEQFENLLPLINQTGEHINYFWDILYQYSKNKKSVYLCLKKYIHNHLKYQK